MGSLAEGAFGGFEHGFAEGGMGEDCFGELLREAERRKLIDLEMDESRGNFKVSLRPD